MDGGAALLDFLQRLVEDGCVSARAGVHLVERVNGFAANSQQADDGGGDAELLEDGHGGRRRRSCRHDGSRYVSPLSIETWVKGCMYEGVCGRRGVWYAEALPLR